MSEVSLFDVVSLALILVGLIVGGWFAVSWGRRIRHRFSSATLDAGGWVYGLVAVYGYAFVGTLRGEFGEPSTVTRAVVRLALMALLDALLVARAVRWWQLGREHPAEVSPHREGTP